MTDTPNTDAPKTSTGLYDSPADWTARLATLILVAIMGMMILFTVPERWNTPFLIVLGILASLAVVLNVLARFRR